MQVYEPYFDVITPLANVFGSSSLGVDPEELKNLFVRLASIDEKRFDRKWDPQPPLVGNRFMRHQVFCVVTATGDVVPGVGVTISLYNIRHNKLGSTLTNSKVINNLKNYRQMIKGACRNCEKAAECYGCRGTAYQLNGNYLALDPTCWCNSASKN